VGLALPPSDFREAAMPLSLSCRCGAKFEVEETLAGQAVTCPECQRSLKAPAVRRGPVSTSGLAIASLVLALLGAFTLVGTLAAIACGLLAVIQISRNRGRLAGTGFALFGIILGVAFTGLTLLAVSRGELFGVGDQLRVRVLGSRLDYSGPLEIVQEQYGFKLTRPSHKWGVAPRDMLQEYTPNSQLLLINAATDAYVDVAAVQLGGQGLDRYRDSLLTTYRTQGPPGMFNAPPGALARNNDFKLRHSQRLPNRDGAEVAEVCFDERVAAQSFTFLIQIVKQGDGDRAYVVRGWCLRRRFGHDEEDLRRVLDSFRVLDRRR